MPTKKVLEKELARLEDEIDELSTKNEKLKISAIDQDEVIVGLKNNSQVHTFEIKKLNQKASDLSQKCTGLEAENKNLMKGFIEMNDKVKELTELSQKVPAGTIVAEQFKGITHYVLEGKSLSRETPGWHPNREALSEAMASQKSSIISQGATDVKQKIKREVTFESDA